VKNALAFLAGHAFINDKKSFITLATVLSPGGFKTGKKFERSRKGNRTFKSV
jgi:hypothetical protein